MSLHRRSAGNVPWRRIMKPMTARRRAARDAGRLFRPHLERMENRTLLATMLWSNSEGGDWDTASNWVNSGNPSDHHVPTSSDDAEINVAGITVTHASDDSDSVDSLSVAAGTTLSLSSGTLSIAAASTISGNLTMTAGTLTCTGTLSVAGALSWTGGTMSGNGTTIAEGGLTLGGSAAGATYVETLSGGTLENAGVGTLASPDDSQGLYLDGGATLENLPGASFNVATDAQIFFGGNSSSNGTVINEGTFAKTGGTGTSSVDVTFNQTGAGNIEVQSGTLGLAGGGTISGTATTGINITSGAALSLGSGTLSLSSATGIADAGILTLDGATVDVNASLSVAGSGVFDISSGTADFSDAATAATLSMSGGTLTGPGDLTITGATSWTGGTMSGSGTTIAEGGLAIGSATAGLADEILSGRTLNNAGVATLSSPNDSYGLYLTGGATLDNAPGSTFNIETDAQIVFGGNSPSDGTVVNEGTFAKTAGTGTSAVGVTFEQGGTGSTVVQSGTLDLTGGGTISGTVPTEISIGAGASLDLSSGTLSITSVTGIADSGTLALDGASINIGANLSIAGTGAFSISSGTTTLDDAVSAQSFLMSGGTLTGPGDLTIGGMTTWTGGTMSGSGTTVAEGGLTLGGTTAGTTFNEILSGRTLENVAAATLSASSDDSGLILADGAEVENQFGGSFSIATDAQISDSNGSAASVVNEGTFAKSGGTGISSIAVAFDQSGDGSISVQSGTLNLTSSVSVEDQGYIESGILASLEIAGGLTGTTQNVDLFNSQGTLILGAFGTPNNLEVMSQDLGNVAAGFVDNFAYGTLELSSGAYIKLVDDAQNPVDTGSEALYVNTLIVPAGSTLDLNGYSVYARQTVIKGTVVHGAVQQVPSGGSIPFGTPLPSDLAKPGQVDSWTFYGWQGHAVTVTVNPSSAAPPSAEPPYVNDVVVSILEPNGNVLASATGTSSGTVVTLAGVTLPADGTYTIDVESAQSGATGDYLIDVYDSTLATQTGSFNQEYVGTLASPDDVDDWTFSGAAQSQLQFVLNAESNPSIVFTLTGPGGDVVFSDQNSTSAPLDLPTSGLYTLSVDTSDGDPGSFSFQVDMTSLTQLTLGQTYKGTLIGSDQELLFQLDVAQAQSLLVLLNDETRSDLDEVYLQEGSPPTRSEYQYRFTPPASANEQVVASYAPAGTWYVLVYTEYAPAPSDFSILATTGSLFLTGSAPQQVGAASDTVLTLTGAGFDQTTQVQLTSADGQAYPAASISIDSPTKITATFAAGSVPAGVYDVEASKPGIPPAALNDSLTIVQGGQAHLQTKLILPDAISSYLPATIYVQYSNTGNIAMPAPLLVLTASENGNQAGFFTLNSALNGNFFVASTSVPAGYTTTVELLAGGANPSILEPGESETVPVYYAGWIHGLWHDGQMSFVLGAVEPNNSTPD
jgi:hypothetical protein